MVKGFKTMPRAMAQATHYRLTTHTLLGNPINKVWGNLIGSFGVTGSEEHAVIRQINTEAPYAPRVMGPVSIARAGKPALELVMDEMNPRFDREIKREFEHIERTIANGGNYKFDKWAFEQALRRE